MKNAIMPMPVFCPIAAGFVILIDKSEVSVNFPKNH